MCGALTLIFGAAARMSEVRKKILDALDCIPDALDVPEALLNIYRTDQALARKATELYMALLEAIEGMLDWLDHKAYSKPHLCLTEVTTRLMLQSNQRRSQSPLQYKAITAFL